MRMRCEQHVLMIMALAFAAGHASFCGPSPLVAAEDADGPELPKLIEALSSDDLETRRDDIDSQRPTDGMLPTPPQPDSRPPAQEPLIQTCLVIHRE